MVTNRQMLTGNAAAAWAARLAEVDYVPAFPITPQTEIIEDLAAWFAEGQMHGRFVTMDSEHAMLMAAGAAAATGCRVFTATSSQGMLYGLEALWTVAGWRVPFVLVNVSRGLAAPITLEPDHNDVLAARDCGCVQIHCETCQEVLDSVLMAYRIAEHPHVLLPVIVNMDGFYLSFTREPVEIPSAADVRQFLPAYKPAHAEFRASRPTAQGVAVLGGAAYSFFRYQMHLAAQNVLQVHAQVALDFEHTLGRHYGSVDTFQLDDAEYVIVMAGSFATKAKAAIGVLREEGKRVGLAAAGPAGDRVAQHRRHNSRGPRSRGRCTAMKATREYFRNLKELPREEMLAPGSPLCAGCGGLATLRLMLNVIGPNTVVVNAAGCLTLMAVYPFTPMRGSWLYTTMASAPAGAQGVRDALDVLIAKGRIAPEDDLKVIVLAGDGSSADMGLSATSGAIHRGLDFYYLCYDNEAYGNTGFQMSSTSPFGSQTATSPVAESQVVGTLQQKKDLFEIWRAHRPPYVATLSTADPVDLAEKVRRSIEFHGPKLFIGYAACPTGWGFDPSQSHHVARLALDSGVWPLKEAVRGEVRHTFIPDRPHPVIEYLQAQRRFRHLFHPVRQQAAIDDIQLRVDQYWSRVRDAELARVAG